MLKNALYLIPVTLGDIQPELVLPSQVFSVIRDLDEFIVENLRSARRFLRKAGYQKEFEEVKFHILNKHTAYGSAPSFVDMIKQGKPVGLLSEAGVPCVADPGAEVVKYCHEASIPVVPLSGPSSIILALMASGFNGQNFTFHGYLPIDNSALKKQIKKLEDAVFQQEQTQIFIETPYRNNRLLKSLISNCNPKIKLCVASEITTEDETIITASIGDWKKMQSDFHKKPAVFLLYR